MIYCSYLWQAIKERQEKALQVAEEKVAVADQSYDVIDKYIRILGGSFAAFIIWGLKCGECGICTGRLRWAL